jgi:hypothetical protein
MGRISPNKKVGLNLESFIPDLGSSEGKDEERGREKK